MEQRTDAGTDLLLRAFDESLKATMDALTVLYPGKAMCLFLFGADAQGPVASYISNAERKSALVAIKQWVALQEGQPDA